MVITIVTNVLKTRLDQSAQSGIRHQFGSVIIKIRKQKKNRKLPEKLETATVKPILESEEE